MSKQLLSVMVKVSKYRFFSVQFDVADLLNDMTIAQMTTKTLLFIYSNNWEHVKW